MKVKILKNYQLASSKFVKGTEVDVDRRTGKRLMKLKVARKFGENIIDKIIIANRKYKSKKKKS